MSRDFEPHVTLDLDQFSIVNLSDDFYEQSIFLNVLQRVILNEHRTFLGYSLAPPLQDNGNN